MPNGKESDYYLEDIHELRRRGLLDGSASYCVMQGCEFGKEEDES